MATVLVSLAIRLMRTQSVVPTHAAAQAALARAAASSDATATAASKRIKIYTKTGDKGESSLFTMERRQKDDVVFEALGATDELSSAVGLALVFAQESGNMLPPKLETIQCWLQDVGSNIATPRTSATEARLKRTEFPEMRVSSLEEWIDEIDKELPPLTTFILPGGGRSSASLHMARSICRRAERRVVPLVRDDQVSWAVARFLNRLSDFFFAAARLAAQHDGSDDVVYKKNKK